MRLKIPRVGAAYDPTVIKAANDKIEQAFTQVASREEAIDRVLFRDSDGVTWAVTMTTAGALTIAAITGKTRDV